LLRKRGTKKIINISSTVGSNTLNEAYATFTTVQAPYNISKGALNILTRQTATELKGEGFIVVPLCPGVVSTDMGATAASSYEYEYIYIPNIVRSLYRKQRERSICKRKYYSKIHEQSSPARFQSLSVKRRHQFFKFVKGECPSKCFEVKIRLKPALLGDLKLYAIMKHLIDRIEPRGKDKEMGLDFRLDEVRDEGTFGFINVYIVSEEPSAKRWIIKEDIRLFVTAGETKYDVKQ